MPLPLLLLLLLLLQAGKRAVQYTEK